MKCYRKTNTVWYHSYVDSKQPNSEKWGVKRWLPEDRGRGNGKTLVKGYKLPVVRLTCSGDLIYSMVIIANNTVLYTWKFVRE